MFNILLGDLRFRFFPAGKLVTRPLVVPPAPLTCTPVSKHFEISAKLRISCKASKIMISQKGSGIFLAPLSPPFLQRCRVPFHASPCLLRVFLSLSCPSPHSPRPGSHSFSHRFLPATLVANLQWHGCSPKR